MIGILEVLCGETVSINQLSLISDSDYVEYIGINNYGEGLIGSFRKINANNYLAFESYKQVLLDEEVKIITYNKFLKVMQIVEGYQRADEEENSIEEFNIKSNRL